MFSSWNLPASKSTDSLSRQIPLMKVPKQLMIIFSMRVFMTPSLLQCVNVLNTSNECDQRLHELYIEFIILIIIDMQGMSYSLRQIVWAKPDRYPWWPATVHRFMTKIAKLPDLHKNNNHFKVLFVGEENYAILEEDKVRKYPENYAQFSKFKSKKLQKAIEKADEILVKKKNSKSVSKGPTSTSHNLALKNQNATNQQPPKHNENAGIDSQECLDNLSELPSKRHISNAESSGKAKRDLDQENNGIQKYYKPRSSRARTIRNYNSPFDEDFQRQKSEVSLVSQEDNLRKTPRPRKPAIRPTHKISKPRRIVTVRKPSRKQEESQDDHCEQEGVQDCSSSERARNLLPYDSDDHINSEQSGKKSNDSDLESIHVFDQHMFVEQVIDRVKIEKITSELNEIITQFQANKFGSQDETEEQWKYEQYFQSFRNDALSCEQLLQSNLTKMLRYIIVRMTELKFHPSKIMPIEQISQQLKTKIMEHLTNTGYYDQYLKLYDRDQKNKKDIKDRIIRAIKRYHRRQTQCISFNQPHSYSVNSFHSVQSLQISECMGQPNSANVMAMSHSHPPKVKNLHINEFAEIICDRVGNGYNFHHQEFINDIKQNQYRLHEILTTKAGTQRFAQTILHKYSHS